MKISNRPGDELVTHALGSCLGITAYDPLADVGGLLHVLLPSSAANQRKAQDNPFMFVDTGVPEFFSRMRAAIGCKRRLIVKVAGGAETGGAGKGYFDTGKRNSHMLRKILWKSGILIDAEDVGGNEPRTMHLEIGTGRVWVSTAGKTRELQGMDTSLPIGRPQEEMRRNG